MVYQFNDILNISGCTDKTVIFTGNNAIGYVENNEVTIQNEEYMYEYRKGGWSIARVENMIMYPCGVGAVPTLDISNLVIVNASLWQAIKYVEEVTA